jgi:PASTA domain
MGIYYNPVYPQQPLPFVVQPGGSAPVVNNPPPSARPQARWPVIEWSAQAAAPIAGLLAPNQPPPFQLVPIFVRDPARPLHGEVWQYGFKRISGAYAGPASQAEVDNPPFPGIHRLGASVARLWSPETWSAQVAPLAVQPGLPIGDYPPGAASPPEPEPWGFWEPYRAQVTRTLSPSILAPPPVNAPRPSSFARFYANVGVWSPDTWNAQARVPVAAFAGSILPPAFHPPWRAALFYANPALRAYPEWDTQRLPTIVQPGGADYPPITSLAALAALRASWGQPQWAAQRLAFGTFLPPPPVVNPPPVTSFQRFYALRGLWIDPTWLAQAGAIIVSTIPPPPVNPPPVGAPQGQVQQSFALGWPYEVWDTRKLITYRGWLGPDVWKTVYDLVNAGLEPTIVWIPSVIVPYSYTISTDPATGTVVPVGTPVTVYASSGLPNPAVTASVTVPDVVGATLIGAREMLYLLGLLTQETWVASNDDAGTVESQNPGSGAMVDPGTTVYLTVSLGPSNPQQTVPVPN